MIKNISFDTYRYFVGLIIVFLLSISLIHPIINSSWFPIHDDAHIARIGQMSVAMKDGHIPVRWSKDLGYGYGYPLFNFYAPLPYYVGSSMVLLFSLNLLIATKLMIGFAIIFSGISMYILTARLWGVWGGIISSIAYLYAPYHAVDLYVRGAVGELYAFVFIPLLILAVIKIWFDNKVSRWPIILFALSYAGLILSHNISALITTMLLLVSGILLLIVIFFKNGLSYVLLSKIMLLFLSCLLGLGLSAFFWLPALVQTHYTNVEKVIAGNSDFHQHFLYLDQLWDSPWGFAGSAEGRSDGMSFKIGKVHIALALLGIASLIWFWKRKQLSKEKKYITVFGCIVLCISIFMTVPYSLAIWETISILAYIQFPWRFLIMIVFCVSLFTGAVVLIKPKQIAQILIAFVLCLIIIFVNEKYFTPQYLYPLSNADYSSNEYIKWYVSSQSDEYLPKEIIIPTSVDEVIKDRFLLKNEGVVESIVDQTQTHILTVSTPSDNELQINIAQFPEWVILLDNVRIIPSKRDGIYALSVPRGIHTIQITFQQNMITQLANTISAISLIVLFGTMIGKPNIVCYIKKQSK